MEKILMANAPIELPETMQAVMCHAPFDYRFEEVPVPEIGPGEVLVQVLLAGICASDAKCYSGAPLFWGDIVTHEFPLEQHNQAFQMVLEAKDSIKVALKP